MSNESTLTHSPTVPGPHALTERAKQVLSIEMEGIAAVRDRLDDHTPDAPLLRALHMLVTCTGRVVVTGIGKSGLVGRKLAATFSSTGTPAFFLHPVEGAHGDLGSIRDTDVILAISNSGETAELNAVLPAMKSLGAGIIALTGGMHSTLARLADITLNTGVPREACPHGLAPTASTTAVLALGDALAVCLMELKSFTEKDFLRFHPGGSLGQRLRLNVSEVMRTEGLPLLPENSTQAEALHHLDKGKMGAVLLLDADRRVCGILTDGDVRRAVCSGRLNLEGAVTDIMTRSPRCGSKQDTVAVLLDLMESKAITVLPIVDENQHLLGMVHMHDLLGQGNVTFSRS